MAHSLEIEVGPVKLILRAAGEKKPSAPSGTSAARAGQKRSEEEVRG